MKIHCSIGSKFLACVLSAVMALSFLGLPTFAEEAVAAETETDLSSMTTFVFDGDSVTVVEGDDTNYEVVVYDSTDTETDASTSTDADGNTVYSVPSDSEGQILVSIKKKGGSYVFEGSGQGSIAVKKEATKDAELYLNGLELTSDFTAVIAVKKDSTAACAIYAVEGTTNTLTDNECNNDEDYTDNAAAENAVMKFKDGSDVTIAGEGTISLVANGKNGIKANGDLEITGDVTLNIESANDAINSSGDLYVTGGTFNIAAGDDAIHADYALNLGNEDGSDDDLTVNITSCNEGLEGATVNVYSGTYNISSSDDSINAANSDLTDYDFSLNIYGGNIYAAAVSGDCIDSNGSLTISGGRVIALGALANQGEETNNALDCDGTFTITGGEVLAVGMQEMSVLPSSSQAYVTWTSAGASTAVAAGSSQGQFGISAASSTELQSGVAAGGGTSPSAGGGTGTTTPGTGETTPGGSTGGTTPGTGGGSSWLVSNGDVVTVYDASGNTLISETAVWATDATSSVNYVFYSSPSVTAGSSYTLGINTEESDSGSGDSDSGDDGDEDSDGSGSGSEGDGSGSGEGSEGDGSDEGDGSGSGSGDGDSGDEGDGGSDNDGDEGSDGNDGDGSGSEDGDSEGDNEGDYYDDVDNIDISQATIEAIPDQLWAGQACEPSPVVYYEGNLLVEDTDYAVTYENNDGPGHATVTITGIGIYAGELTCSFLVYYSDVPTSLADEWYYDYIYELADLDVMSGYAADYRFGMGDSILRQDVVTMLWRYCCPDEYAVYDASLAVNESGLSDIEDGQYYTEAVNWAVEAGVVTGYTEGEDAGTFGVGDTMTFEQLVTVIARMELGGEDAAAAYSTASLYSGDFADASQVSEWAAGPLSWAVDRGLVTGYVEDSGSASLAPLSDVERERVATVLARYIEMAEAGE